MKEITAKVSVIITINVEDENICDEAINEKVYQVIDEMDYHFISTTDDALITDTEIRDTVII